MTSAPYRIDELSSVQALRDLEILDTAAEPEFDALAHAAAVVCDAPMALVSLVDMDRQWFKARVNFEDCTETPRDQSFCAHAVLADTLFEVEDTTRDARFALHPAVLGSPHIRFYAGAPLRLSNGLRVGTLCVMDHSGRVLSEPQRTALQALATVVVCALEGRQALRRLRTNREACAAGGAPALVDQALTDIAEALRQVTAAEAVERSRVWRAALPSHLAVQHCLTSTLSLLGITRRLLQPEQHLTPVERAQAWTELAEDTKTAGRSAYRAALVLTDPQAGEVVTGGAPDRLAWQRLTG